MDLDLEHRKRRLQGKVGRTGGPQREYEMNEKFEASQSGTEVLKKVAEQLELFQALPWPCCLQQGYRTPTLRVMSVVVPNLGRRSEDRYLAEHQARLYTSSLKARYTAGMEFAIHHCLQTRLSNWTLVHRDRWYDTTGRLLPRSDLHRWIYGSLVQDSSRNA